MAFEDLTPYCWLWRYRKKNRSQGMQMVSKKWVKQRDRFFSLTSKKEHSPADTLILAQRDPHVLCL